MRRLALPFLVATNMAIVGIQLVLLLLGLPQSHRVHGIANVGDHDVMLLLLLLLLFRQLLQLKWRLPANSEAEALSFK